MAKNKQEESTSLLTKTHTSYDNTQDLKNVSSFSSTYPSENATCTSLLFFTWLTPILTLGRSRPLDMKDLYQLDPPNRATHVHATFDAAWQHECQTSSSPRLYRALFRAFGWPFITAGLLKLLHDSLLFVAPMVIQDIIAFLNAPVTDTSATTGMRYVAAIFISGVIQSFALRQYFFNCYMVGMRLRSAIVTSVYRKSLRLSASARGRFSSGEITNLMSVDAQRLQDVTPYMHGLWFSLFQITASMVLLWQQLGPSCLTGVVIIISTIPLTSVIASRMRVLQKALMRVKDDRIKLCYDCLNGMKIIKLYAWEDSFLAKVMDSRATELAQLKSYVLTRAFSMTLFNAIPSLVAVGSFATYVTLGHTLTVSTALTSLALFNILRFPLFLLPQVINNLVEATVSLARLTAFLQEEERTEVGTGHLVDDGIQGDAVVFGWTAVPSQKEVAKKTTHDTASSTVRSEALVSHTPPSFTVGPVDLSLTASQPLTVAIVGAVGSGKSTLLKGVLGEAALYGGSLARRGSVAYVAQQPFIQNATVRQNILFGKMYDAPLYQQALVVAALKTDLLLLPDGDATIIGEKGITLSGGQKIRVTLARAFYQQASLVLLDDPFAALDAAVGATIFQNLVLEACAAVTVLLVTHSLSVASKCDVVIVLEAGQVVATGSYATLLSSCMLFRDMASSQGLSLESPMSSPVATELSTSLVSPAKQDQKTRQTDLIFQEMAQHQEVPLSDTKNTEKEKEGVLPLTRTSSAPPSQPVSSTSTSGVVAVEERSTGDVAWSVYRTWLNAGGGLMIFASIIFLAIASQVTSIGSTVWLSYWSQNNPQEETMSPLTMTTVKSSQWFYLNIYTALNMLYALIVFVQSLALYYMGLDASSKLFASLLDTLLHVPMKFYETTPMGRVINRLSKDIYSVDEQIPSSMGMYLRCLVLSGSTLMTILYVTPMFAVLLGPILVSYIYSQRYFIHTSRELQRLDSISRSPLYSLLGETLDGLVTIHATSGAEKRFNAAYYKLLDTNQRAFFLNYAANCWLALRLEFSGTCIASGAALFAVLQHGHADATFAGLAGVSLSYAFNVTQTLNWSVRMISQLQTQLVSVERIEDYTTLVREGPFDTHVEIQRHLINHAWPSSGSIDFSKVTLRYAMEGPVVLDALSFSIASGEKIGIVGRTGAGKSSLLAVLMRLVPFEGQVKIDGQDIAQLGLHPLRRLLSVIPQDPVLFHGTIRSNLDPFDTFDDATLWNVLRRTQCTRFVTSLSDVVAEGGSNISVGERQLVCFARALLRDTKILLLDEATASVDGQTDVVLQTVLREAFATATVLTIAHRLRTVMDSTRILVLDAGKVVEFDTPSSLLTQPDGMFTHLVSELEKSGQSMNGGL